MDKGECIERIDEELTLCNDITLLDLILQILSKANNQATNNAA